MDPHARLARAARLDARVARIPSPDGTVTVTVEAADVRYAKSGDVSIAYSVVGDASIDLVFVNGGSSLRSRSPGRGPAADFFTRLASFSRLILFDKRRTGLSDRDAGIADLETGWTTSAR